MKKIIFIIAVILASLISASSQDRIITTDQQVLEVYIVEKNDKSIKYHLANDLQQTLFETKLSNPLSWWKWTILAVLTDMSFKWANDGVRSTGFPNPVGMYYKDFLIR